MTVVDRGLRDDRVRRGRRVSAADEREHIDFELTPTTSSTHTPLTFGELYAAEFTPLVRLATLLVGNVEPARDIVQDAFVRLHVKWHTVREPHAYVRRSVVNGATSYHRRNRFRKTSSVGDVEQTITREHQSAASPRTSTTAGFDHTLATLRVLNARQRAVVVLKFYEQRTEPEIAAIVGCRVGSVGPTLQRALGILRSHQSPAPQSATPRSQAPQSPALREKDAPS